MSALDGVDAALTGLIRARALQQHAAQVGFDWPELAPVFDKVVEELNELSREETRDAREAELGDLLFACVNLARHMSLDPEAALTRANAKFERRFSRVEGLVSEHGQAIASVPLEILDRYWNQAKREGL